MRRIILRCFFYMIMIVVVIAVGSMESCAPQTPEEKAAASGTRVIFLIPEDKVRFSNDPEKTEAFRDAGLGLFIHWGPNSQMGTEISWPLHNVSDDYIKKYYALVETFNPKGFNPAEWARLAKLSGMEYVVFTAKHHDDFCMFDTAYSDFKITKTPYGKDIVAQVAEVFRREGILVSFYSPGGFCYQHETRHHFSHLYEADFSAAVCSALWSGHRS